MYGLGILFCLCTIASGGYDTVMSSPSFFLKIFTLVSVIGTCFLPPQTVSAWTKTANFESGTVGVAAQGVSGFDYAGSATTFSSDRAAPGGGMRSAKGVWSAGDDGWGVVHGEMAYPSPVTTSQQIWMRGYYYFQSPWNWGTNHVKIFRMGVDPSRGWMSIIGVGGLITTSDEPENVCGPDVFDADTSASFDIDAWQSLEMYFNMSTTNPIFRVWKNGILIYNRVGLPPHITCAAGDTSSLSNMMNTWNGGAPQTQTQYMDEFVITTDTPAARDVANNPMIGPIGWGGTPDTTPPAVPMGLGVQ